MTGTRGKSSVTRLIAAAIREKGIAVIAKTTGSMPTLILPDGSEMEIRRRGNSTILEGKKILKACAKVGIQAAVLELMSIQPESLFVESVQMMQPNILVLTNVRVDHTEQMGTSREEVACSLAASLPEKCTVFIPVNQILPSLRKEADERGAELVSVPEDFFDPAAESQETFPASEFTENISLALGVADFLEIDRETALRGMAKAHPDFGSVKMWQAEWRSPSRAHYFVSAFAANDPESTSKVLSWLEERGLFEKRKVIGLLCLRSDRGDRTLQWMKALKEESCFRFDRIALFGEHAKAFRKLIKSSAGQEFHVLKAKKPEDIMIQLSASQEEETVFVGMGNMKGMGRQMVEHWERRGKRCDL